MSILSLHSQLDMNEATGPFFIVQCGLPASGKSTDASKIQEAIYNTTGIKTEIISTDSIRKELTGTVSIDTKFNPFPIAYKRITDCLKQNKNVIFDATNKNTKKRLHLLNLVKKYNTRTVLNVYVNDIDELFKRDSERSKRVGNKVILNHLKCFQAPNIFTESGWNSINIITGKKHYPINMIVKNYASFDQHNDYHVLTLGKHTQAVIDYIISHKNEAYNYDALLMAAYFHDAGKPFTVTADKYNKNKWHYFGHENASAYMLLNTAISNHKPEYDNAYDLLYAANLVQLHSRLFNNDYIAKLQAAKQYPISFLNDLELLHQADIS